MTICSGHINHSLFWKNLAPEGPSNKPHGALKQALEKDFGSVDAFKKAMNEKTAAIQGSGWGWLASSIYFALHMDIEVNYLARGIILSATSWKLSPRLTKTPFYVRPTDLYFITPVSLSMILYSPRSDPWH